MLTFMESTILNARVGGRDDRRADRVFVDVFVRGEFCGNLELTPEEWGAMSAELEQAGIRVQRWAAEPEEVTQ